MKSAILVLICLALGCQAGVLKQSKELQDIPVIVVQEPVALPLSQPEQPDQPEQLKQQPAEPVERQERTSVEQSQPVAVPAAVAVPPAAVELPVESVPAASIKQAKIESEPTPAEPIDQAKIEPEPEPKLNELPAEPIKQQKIEPAEKQPEQPAAAIEPQQQPKELPAAPIELEQKLNELVSESIKQLPQAVPEAVQPQVRQATQATPVQSSSTQQNFVQQLLQNSPIGQFRNQFNNQPQQQQADQPATPAPTVPGFLNPSAAITSAQQAVQNAAQTVQNATSQAFQGIQQFANNLGTQFQNTLSGLTGQQQQQQQPQQQSQSSAEASTARPPGPIQSFVNNVFGGGANATAPAAPANPLQGIINFLGGNRPQNANNAAPATDKPAVDEKIDNSAPEEQSEQLATEAEAANEVRNSGEVADDSFEEAVSADEVIVVNDDSNDVVATAAVEAEPQPQVVQPAEISV